MVFERAVNFGDEGNPPRATEFAILAQSSPSSAETPRQLGHGPANRPTIASAAAERTLLGAGSGGTGGRAAAGTYPSLLDSDALDGWEVVSIFAGSDEVGKVNMGVGL